MHYWCARSSVLGNPFWIRLRHCSSYTRFQCLLYYNYVDGSSSNHPSLSSSTSLSLVLCPHSQQYACTNIAAKQSRDHPKPRISGRKPRCFHSGRHRRILVRRARRGLAPTICLNMHASFRRARRLGDDPGVIDGDRHIHLYVRRIGVWNGTSPGMDATIHV